MVQHQVDGIIIKDQSAETIVVIPMDIGLNDSMW